MTDTNKTLYVLHETAAGYCLFEVVSFEEIGAMVDESTSTTVADSITELGRFSRAVKLSAFQPFETAQEALENANAVSEHAMTSVLKSFLEMNLPLDKKSKKKKKKAADDDDGPTTATYQLGIVDTGLATAIAEGLPELTSCRSDDTVREIVRGIRCHLTHYVKGLSDGGNEGRGGAIQAQLGLGHSYSRSKVKFNPHRSDNMIIQSIALLDQMDKDLNTFAMRVREWYSWHFPELKDLVKDNYMFARAAALVQDRTTLFQKKNDEDDDENEDSASSKLSSLTDIVGDPEVANTIVAAAKSSMGMDCNVVDMVNIVNFTQRLVKLAEYRKQLAAYLADKMSSVAPNLSAILGDSVAARLIAKAGSLTNLAKAPASTVQILGAEKALFRALKTKGNTPKYGLIYHSTFIGRADAKNKGRISRYLANKCSIATRIDSFSDDPCDAYGKKLREQVEERLKFYETGANPRKNIDVMKEVSRNLLAHKGDEEEGGGGGDKQLHVDDDDMDSDKEDEGKKKKKKKDKKKRKSDVSMEDADEKTPKKSKAEDEKAEEPKSSSKKSKKKSKKNQDDGDVTMDTATPATTPTKSSSEDKEPTSEKKSSKKEKKSAKKKKKSKD